MTTKTEAIKTAAQQAFLDARALKATIPAAPNYEGLTVFAKVGG